MLEKRMQRNELFQILNQYFNIDELKMIFCLLELDYSPIKWQPKNEVTDLLLDEVLKSDTQHTLIKIVEEQRPFLFNLPRNKDKSASLPALDSKTNFMMLNRGGLLKLLNSDFSISQLYQLANELDVDETSFPAQQTKIGFILDLILFWKRLANWINCASDCPGTISTKTTYCQNKSRSRQLMIALRKPDVWKCQIQWISYHRSMNESRFTFQQKKSKLSVLALV